MTTAIPGSDGWCFEVDEVSAGVYRVVGTNERGHSVSETGTDVDDLLSKCQEAAARLACGATGMRESRPG